MCVCKCVCVYLHVDGAWVVHCSDSLLDVVRIALFEFMAVLRLEVFWLSLLVVGSLQ